MSPEQTPGETQQGKIEPIVMLLFSGMIFFTIMLVVVDRLFPMETQAFDVIRDVITTLLGALILKINPAVVHAVQGVLASKPPAPPAPPAEPK